MPIELVVSSALDRTKRTAECIAKRIGKTVEYSENLLEIDFGDWTGLPFEELSRNDNWRRWNQLRSCTRIPGGESIIEVQSRMVWELENISQRLPERLVAVVSHGDPIKTAISYYIGIPLDHMLRLRIDTASYQSVNGIPN